MKFDKVVTRNFQDTIIDYGIVNGDNNIFFIKTGQNGLIEGYDNKYLIMAKDIHEKYGFTVIVSSNPSTSKEALDHGIKFIQDYNKKRNIDDYNIYFMGYSNGGLQGSLYGVKYPEIKRMLLVNTPIREESFQNLKDFKGEFITFVYGELDPSFKYIKYLFSYLDEKVGLEIIEEADHHFTNQIDIFINLPEKYLFYDLKKLTK